MDVIPTPTTTTAPATAKSTDAAAAPEDHGGPRRRAAGQKRKSNNWTQTPSSSSSKRVARNKTLASSPLPHHLHNGPITRARQSPNKVAFASPVPVPTPDAHAAATESALVRNASSVDAAKMGMQALREDSNPPVESVIDSEFEAVRSRDRSAHVVPTPAAWFSWSEIHPLEERALASFFDGKSKKRTPDTYMEIRNFLMKKYHSDPNTQIESKDLPELDIGELDMRQEIMEFLDHWGLINFHPFPVSESDKADVNADVPSKIGSLLEKLYRFEAVLPHSRLGPAANVAVPAIRPWLVPESSIVDEVRAEGPSVEYHCNSCSGDCSRKRFHCQKQADFDLCSDCFSNGKFDSGMSPADFILMESAEVPGVSGGSWTDQETLLLLEALELFGENWNEIAEHVATKSKTQCILHFLQMPIEDTFLEGGDGFEISAQGKSDPVLSGSHASPAKDTHETLMDKSATSNDTSTLRESTEAKMGGDHPSTLSVSAETKISKDEPSTPKVSLETSMSKDAVKNDSTTANDVPETMETKNATNGEPHLSEKGDILEPKDAAELNVPPETSTASDFVINVLKEAFQAVGFFPGPGESFSFAEAGNPVMALAVYLAGLVDADMSTASARSSLKALSEDASGIQLATRHSFILEDLPDNLKNAPASESADVKMLDQDTEKNEGQKEGNIQGEDQMSAFDGSDASKDNIDQKKNVKVSNEKQLLSSSNEGEENSLTTKHVDGAVGEKDVNPSYVEESGNSTLPVSAVPEPGDQTVPMDVNLTPSTVMKLGEVTPITVKNSEEVTPSTIEKDVTPSTAEKEDTPDTVDKPGEVTPADVMRSDEVASPSTSKIPSSSVKESTDAAAAMESANCTEVPKAVDKVFNSVPSEDKNTLQTVASNSNTEPGTDTVSHAGDNDASKLVGSNMPATREEQVVDRLKRAAVTTLSAAAVKAKLFADEEEYQIKKLATFLIDKQLHKLETKMAFFNDMDSKLNRVREQIENSRKRLYQERAHIIATRLGLPAQSSRGMPSSLPASRFAMNYANSAPKPLPRGPIPPSR